MERVIDCPVCYNTDNCFEEVQETFSSYLCFNCGFMSDSRYETGVRDSQFKDKDRNITWFPSVINMGTLGMIYPEGTSKAYVWKYAKIVNIPEQERVNFNNYSQRLDVEGAETFEQQDFMGACKAMGITQRVDNV